MKTGNQHFSFSNDHSQVDAHQLQTKKPLKISGLKKVEV